MTLISLGNETSRLALLDAMANELLLATTPQQQLNAVMGYPMVRGATAASLYYVDNQDANQLVLAAEWVRPGTLSLGVGFVLPASAFPSSVEAHLPPVMPVLINDIRQMTTPPAAQAALQQQSTIAFAFLPLSNQGNWIGALLFSWDKPQSFTEQDERIYAYIIQQSTAAIHVLRLLEQTQQRATELEIINKELDLLYQASELINAANSYQEILEAIASFDPDADAVAMMIWEHWDYHSAEYIEPVALLVRTESPMQANDHLPKAGFPICEEMWNERVWLFEDTQTDPRVDLISRQHFAAIGSRAFLGAALYVHQRWIGGVTFHSRIPRHYSEREVRLFTAIGDLVLAAVRRIYLQQETDISRQRAEILARINTMLLQAKDERGILDAVASYVATLDIYGMSLSYIDTDDTTGKRVWRPVAIWQDGAAIAFDPVRYPDVQSFNDHIADLWTTNPTDVLYVEDVLTDERMVNLRHQAYISYTPVCAFVVIPLVIRQHFYGMVRIIWDNPHRFSDFERGILDSLLRILPFVVASRRSYLAERQRANELEAIARVSAAAASILNEETMLRTISDLADQQFADYTLAIFLLDEEGQTLKIDKDDTHAPIALTDAHSPEAYVARERQSIIINDIQRAGDYHLRPFDAHIRSMMALPIMAGEKLLGVLEIQCHQLNRFSSDDLRVMSTLGDLIAVAIQNARLYERSLSLAVLEERNRLARELHDSVSQAMYGIALGARTARTMLERDVTRLAEPLDYVLSLSEAGLAEMRALIFELRPETLEKEGLVEALARQVTMLEARYGIHVTLNARREPVLSFRIKEAIYWIVREALHNIVKHARATDVYIRILQDADSIEITVTDNGIGFDPNTEYVGHMGLQSMRERCKQIGGTLTIESQPNAGCTITFRVMLTGK